MIISDEFIHRAADTDYAKQNGGKWDYIVEKEKSIPVDKVTRLSLLPRTMKNASYGTPQLR